MRICHLGWIFLYIFERLFDIWEGAHLDGGMGVTVAGWWTLEAVTVHHCRLVHHLPLDPSVGHCTPTPTSHLLNMDLPDVKVPLNRFTNVYTLDA